MEQEKELTGQESLELISRMISKAKRDYQDTGLSALLWGSTITICSLVSFANAYIKIPALDLIWYLPIVAVAVQVYISIRESKRRKLKAHDDNMMGGIWISFGIATFMLSYFVNRYQLDQSAGLFLTLYGIPTFTTGYARHFRPMLFGGLACWIFAIVSSFTPYPYIILYLTAAAQLAWFIPGLILRKRYLKANKENV